MTFLGWWFKLKTNICMLCYIFLWISWRVDPRLSYAFVLMTHIHKDRANKSKGRVYFHFCDTFAVF